LRHAVQNRLNSRQLPRVRNLLCSVRQVGADPAQYSVLQSEGKYDLCTFYFTNRVVSTRNSVPSYVVSANTLHCLKSTFFDK